MVGMIAAHNKYVFLDRYFVRTRFRGTALTCLLKWHKNPLVNRSLARLIGTSTECMAFHKTVPPVAGCVSISEPATVLVCRVEERGFDEHTQDSDCILDRYSLCTICGPTITTRVRLAMGAGITWQDAPTPTTTRRCTVWVAVALDTTKRSVTGVRNDPPVLSAVPESGRYVL